ADRSQRAQHLRHRLPSAGCAGGRFDHDRHARGLGIGRGASRAGKRARHAAGAAMSQPLTVVRNIGFKIARRAAAVPKRAQRVARRAERFREQAAYLFEEERLAREIAAVASGRGPIIVGPWLSEVGFEVLYWIPFLRWFVDRYRVDPARVVAVS